MKFDVVIGNPPYQDGNNQGGNNKLYYSFSNKAVEMSNRFILFVTPKSFLKKSKRGSLRNYNGVQEIKSLEPSLFNVGVDVCYWFIDKSYKGDIKFNDIWFDKLDNRVFIDDKIDEKFIVLYEKLKKITNRPEDRMFKQNTFSTTSDMSTEKNEKFKFEIYSINKNKEKKIWTYGRKKPNFFNDRKAIISLTKTDKDLIMFEDKDDYSSGFMCIKINSNEQIENIKSFIQSDYFIEHTKKWKKFENIGYAYSIKHLPPFDMNKSWNNESVKEFLESFINEETVK